MPSDTGGRGGGFLEGLSTLVEKLAELAEKGDRLQKSGEIGPSDKDKKVKAAYDIDIRVGAGGPGKGEEGPRVEPVGKAAPERPGKGPAVQPIREPFVDVFDEAGGLMVVAQLPGVECREIVLELRGDILSIQAEHDGLRYQKELLLPRSYPKEQMHASCRNGLLEIRMAVEEGGVR